MIVNSKIKFPEVQLRKIDKKTASSTAGGGKMGRNSDQTFAGSFSGMAGENRF